LDRHETRNSALQDMLDPKSRQILRGVKTRLQSRNVLTLLCGDGQSAISKSEIIEFIAHNELENRKPDVTARFHTSFFAHQLRPLVSKSAKEMRLIV
jgi:hypothetical protein